MILEEAILKEHSSKQATKIANYLIKHPEEIESFLDLLHHGSDKVSQYGSYTMHKLLNTKHKDLLVPYLPKIHKLTKLKNKHEALLRNSYKAFGELTSQIPDDLSGIIYDEAYAISTNLKYSLACRSYALQILHNFLKQFPELLSDIAHIAALLEKDKNPAIISRINHINKTISKLRKGADGLSA